MTYAAVDRTIWAQPAVRQLTPQDRLLLLYFLASDRGNMIGVFVCPPAFVAYYTGIPEADVLESLRGSLSVFLDYDAESEEVFVHAAARMQIGRDLAPGDKRRVRIQNQVRDIISDHLRRGFLEQHADWELLAEDTEGPSKGLLPEPEGASKGDPTVAVAEAVAETGQLEADALRVFDYWKQKRHEVLALNCGPRVEFIPQRKGKVVERLRTGWTAEELMVAVDGCLSDDFNIKGKHTDLELICRSGVKTRRYYDLASKVNKDVEQGLTPEQVRELYGGPDQ